MDSLKNTLILLFSIIVISTSQYAIKNFIRSKGVTKRLLKSNLHDFFSNPDKYKVIPKQHKYSMSYHEFKTIIIPLLSRYPLYSIGYSDDEIKLLYDYSNYELEWQDRNAVIDKLRWVVSEKVWRITQDLRRNYEMLMGYKQSGNNETRILVSEECTCLGFLNNKCESTQRMIDAYTKNNDDCPILPPPEIICLQDCEMDYKCNLRIQSIPLVIWHDQEVQDIPANWKEHLRGMLKSHFSNKLQNVIESINSTSFNIDHFDDYYTVKNPAQLLASKLSAKELRVLQRKNNLSGLRAKIDIAQQLVSDTSCRKDLNLEFLKIRNSELENLYKHQVDLYKEKEYITEFIKNIN